MPNVAVEDQNIRFEAPAGGNLRKELLQHKVKLYHGVHRLLNCHGKGMCGACLVRVVSNPSGLTDRTETEQRMLFETNPHVRLACQAELCGDVVVNCEAN